jgi:hypothetical protein
MFSFRAPLKSGGKMWIMINSLRALVILAVGLVLLPLTPAQAQSCNPAAVHYIMRDEKGAVVKGEELKSVHQQLPETIGNAQTAVGEVSFAGDGVTFYWPESVEYPKGNKVPVLEFANARTCTLNLGQVDLSYRGKQMHLLFNIDIARFQDDRRPVIDSLPFKEGSYRLDLTGWSHSREQLIPANRWKKVESKKSQN